MSSLWNFVGDDEEDEQTRLIRTFKRAKKKRRKNRTAKPEAAGSQRVTSPLQTVPPPQPIRLLSLPPQLKPPGAKPPRVRRENKARPAPLPAPNPDATRWMRVLSAIIGGHYTVSRLIEALADLKPIAIYAALFDLRKQGLIRSERVDVGDGIIEYRELVNAELANKFMQATGP